MACDRSTHIKAYMMPFSNGTCDVLSNPAFGRFQQIASRTMMRLRQVAIPFPECPWQESLLQHVAESMFMLTPDDIRGQLTETPRGPGLVSDFALELTIPLSDEDGTRFLSMLVGDRMESPRWEEGSHEEEGF